MSDQPSTTTTGSSASSSSSGRVDNNVTISSNIFIPIVAVIVGIFLFGAITAFRRQLITLFRKIFGLAPLPAHTTHGHAENGQAPGQISAEQLAGTSAAPSGTGRSPAVVAGAGARGRRGRRGVRRTDSGASIRTLPAYSKEAGDEELVLVRRQSMGSVDELDEAEEGDNGTMEMRERRTSLSGVLDRVASVRRSGSIRSIASAMSRRSTRLLAETVSTPPNAETIPEQPSSPQSAPPRTRQLSQANSVRSRGWGEAPTYLEAMSSPQPESRLNAEPQEDDPAPRSTLRERTSSTFLNLLSRTGLVPNSSSNHDYSDPYNTGRTRNPPSSSHNRRPSSSASLLLQPQTSRLSGRSFDPTTSAYPSPWTSTHSLGLISPPVLNSAVRASFETNDLPRAGLSDDQMRFLGTKEATSLAGVRVGEVPVSKRRRGSGTVPGPRNVSGGSRLSVASAEDGNLPTWDELDGERRRTQAEDGRGRADVLLAGGVEVGTIVVEADPKQKSPTVSTTAGGSSSSASVRPNVPSDPSSPSQPSSTTISTSNTVTDSSTPPAPPRLDIVAPTPTATTFPNRFPIVANSAAGTRRLVSSSGRSRVYEGM